MDLFCRCHSLFSSGFICTQNASIRAPTQKKYSCAISLGPDTSPRSYADPHDQWKRVKWPGFFHGRRLSLEAKLVSTNDRPSIFLIIFRLFPRGGGGKMHHRILHDPVGGTLQGMWVEFFGQKIEDLTYLFSTLILASGCDNNVSLSHLP